MKTSGYHRTVTQSLSTDAGMAFAVTSRQLSDTTECPISSRVESKYNRTCLLIQPLRNVEVIFVETLIKLKHMELSSGSNVV